MATAQHISNRRATVELRALPGLCQGLIRARSDMSEGEGRRIHTLTHIYTPHTHTQTHTLDILLFFLAGDSHGNSSRNPFSTDTGTAVQIANKKRSIRPLCIQLERKTLNSL